MITLINQTVGNYKVIKLLGEGGMGAVYLAEHPVIGRKVAIKVLHISLARDAEIVARFFNEARAIHTIGHQNIVEILDFGQTPDGQPYFIMEYLAGESLNDRIARGPMTPTEAAEIADQICRALSAAHAKGIVHRDLKPHNVHVDTNEEGKLIVKLLDFGVAKILSATETGGQSVKTRTGSLMGTPLYMSPEQCRGSGTLDHRTDIYSLGVMVYEMLAGRPPFNAEGVGELFAKHMLEAPPSLSEFAPETPAPMVAAVMKSLSKELEQRFQTMEEFRVALVNGAKGTKVPTIMRTGVTRPTGTVKPPAQQSTTLSSASSEIEDDLALPKRRSGVAIGALAVVAASVLAVVLLRKPSAPEPAPAAQPPVAAAPAPAPVPAPPPAPTTVTIRMDATPAGVHVFRASDDADLGPVPVEEKVAKSATKASYVFKLDGYKDQSLTVEHNSDHTLHAALEKEAAPVKAVAAPEESKPAKKQPAPTSHRAARRNRLSPDEDGLATPNF